MMCAAGIDRQAAAVPDVSAGGSRRHASRQPRSRDDSSTRSPRAKSECLRSSPASITPGRCSRAGRITAATSAAIKWDSHAGVTAHVDEVRADFESMAAAGFEVTRWFVFTDGRGGVEWSATGELVGHRRAILRRHGRRARYLRVDRRAVCAWCWWTSRGSTIRRGALALESTAFSRSRAGSVSRSIRRQHRDPLVRRHQRARLGDGRASRPIRGAPCGRSSTCESVRRRRGRSHPCAIGSRSSRSVAGRSDSRGSGTILLTVSTSSRSIRIPTCAIQDRDETRVRKNGGGLRACRSRC